MNVPPPHSDDLRAGLRPPQFGLRTVWLGITCLCVLMAAMKWLPPMVSAVLAVLSLSVVAHVLGNALGMQLRSSGNRRITDPGPTETPRGGLTPADVKKLAPPSQLTQRQSLGRFRFISPIIGSVAMAIGGYFWLLQMLGRKATWGNVSFGVGAFLVIGGILGYLAGTFLQVLISANVEAWRNGEPPP
ncbi:MAG: hypothetical protein U0939_10325 [Pirellulales bacterium]